MLKNIHEILAYQNQAICDRYRRDYPKNSLTPEVALREVIKYFYLSQQYQEDKKKRPDDEALNFICGMYPDMREIDDMWHTFLLFTKDYLDFCNHYFGKFIHHTPKTEKDIVPPELFEQEFSRYLSYVYDHLGEETIRVWFPELVE